MIPSSFIFTEATATADARAQMHHLAQSLVAFVVIGAGAIGLYAVLASSFVAGFPEIAPWEMRALLAASLLVPAYQLHRRFCFASTASHGFALPRYAAMQMGIVLLAALFSEFAHGTTGLAHLTTVFVVFVLTAGLSFSLLRVWAFASR